MFDDASTIKHTNKRTVKINTVIIVSTGTSTIFLQMFTVTTFRRQVGVVIATCQDEETPFVRFF